ncbi:hypothetical protein GCM10023322_51890 [Rugosimonospora acidiphila]|uniref:Type VII secretion protein EccB n=1 Tax=Rugosimonospora acidiphila TaxID=556531 RepID=A0ABP9SAE7_9ACTN
MTTRTASPARGRTIVALAALAALFAAMLLVLSLGAGRAAAAPSAPYWVVPGQPGTTSDLTLPDVAQRLLGDGGQWPAIFNLNEGRTQPDGSTLTDPSQLHAGWVLVLPAGATSGEIRVGQPPTGAPGRQSPGAAVGSPSGAPPARPRVLGLQPAVAAGAGAAVLATVASATVAVVRLRRRERLASVAPAASGSRAALDGALRQLAAQATQAQVYAAVIGPDRVSLRLAPAVPEAPAPWQVRERGGVWEAPNWQLDPGGYPGGSGLPLLATVGTIGGELTVVNLGRAPGVVALTGDQAVAMSVVGGFLDEIGADPAAASVAITVVGPVPGTRLPAGRLRVAADVRELTDVFAPGTAAPDGLNPAQSLARELVVVTAPVGSVALERLGVLAARSDNTAAVLVVGDAPNAAWRFECADGGFLDVGVLGLHLDAPSSARNRPAS